jgi:hypothetical protein
MGNTTCPAASTVAMSKDVHAVDGVMLDGYFSARLPPTANPPTLGRSQAWPVRAGSRPFLSVADAGRRHAGGLRDKPTIKWDKDRGGDVPSAPWYVLGLLCGGKVGNGNHDHHLQLAAKHKAQEDIR